MADAKPTIQSLSDSYQSLQTNLSDLISARQKLESQQQENLSVQTEFSSLPDEATIYKLVGPVLLKQETDEAKRTVGGRLEFIKGEM
jgi:prefoldin beta subunit